MKKSFKINYLSLMRYPKKFLKFSVILFFLFAITLSSYGQEEFIETRPEINIVYIYKSCAKSII